MTETRRTSELVEKTNEMIKSAAVILYTTGMPHCTVVRDVKWRPSLSPSEIMFCKYQEIVEAFLRKAELDRFRV